MREEFWLSDRAWASLEPLLPTNQPGARRVDGLGGSSIIHTEQNSLSSTYRTIDIPSTFS